MPANLPPQYYEAEKRFRLARTDKEKLVILKEMWAIMPKHKGTDRLQGELKAKLSQLKKEMQTKKKSGKSFYSHHIEKEGAAQVVLIGLPNAGKSQIVTSLTNATPQVASYPFTTREPLVGMMPFKDIKIQLIDTPPITEEFIEPWLPEIVKYADYVILVVDLGSEEVLNQIDVILKRLEQSKIKLAAKEEENDELNARFYKKTMIVGNKNDIPDAEEHLKVLKDLHGDNFLLLSISAKKREGLQELKRKIYEELAIIRVYTKESGKSADMDDPIVLKKGSRLIDAARVIHKDFAFKLKYAKVWGSSKFDGQKVDRNHLLEDGDVVEFHL